MRFGRFAGLKQLFLSILILNYTSGSMLAMAQTDSSIPENPSAPPQLKRIEEDIERFEGCDRTFVYRGRTYAIDSYYRKDAENLRPVIKDVPPAVNQLNSYQSTRRSVNLAAYTGTAGVLFLLMGLFGNTFFDGGTQNVVRTIGLWGGAGLTAGSGIYAFGILNSNESRISNAVDAYNKARPSDAIQLQFTTDGFF